jgi:hypothetical protein
MQTNANIALCALFVISDFNTRGCRDPGTLRWKNLKVIDRNQPVGNWATGKIDPRDLSQLPENALVNLIYR